MARNASLAGVPGGKGTAGPVAPPPPAEDKSRLVQLSGSATWNCPFPPEADAEQIDQAVVGVQVTVLPDGSAKSASVVSDPGHGFGRMAKQCALARRYQPALDRSGAAILGSGLVNVRFSR
jgi:protein TonB